MVVRREYFSKSFSDLFKSLGEFVWLMIQIGTDSRLPIKTGIKFVKFVL